MSAEAEMDAKFKSEVHFLPILCRFNFKVPKSAKNGDKCFFKQIQLGYKKQCFILSFKNSKYL
jgi:hypothetical protein